MDAISTELGDASSSIPKMPRSRLDWLDIAKGIGIILVVAGHSIGGVMALALPDRSLALVYTYAGIYSFHMDLFFFLSGLTIAARIQKNKTNFLKNNFTKIAYSYVIWATIQYNVLYFVGAGLANNPLHGYNIGTILTGNIAQFWFLYSLFFLNLACYAFLGSLGPLPLLLLALAVRPFALTIPFAGQTFQFALPFMLGVALGANRLDAALRLFGGWRVVALVVFALLDLSFVLSPMVGGMPAGFDGEKAISFVYSMPILPTSILLCAAVIGVAAITTGRLKGPLAYVGRMSLPIFILHIMCIAGIRIFLNKVLHVPSSWLILAIIVPCGVIVPIVAVNLLDRLKLARPLGLL